VRFQKFIIILSIFLQLGLLGCKKKDLTENLVINLKDRFYWAKADAKSTIEDAETLRFHKFSTDGVSNILDVAGKEQEYVWLMAVFALPEDLRGKALGLLISYLHFADKVWVNGTFVGSYGQFPPHSKSSLWGSHFYSIPEPLLNPVGRNIILIKVYCKGQSGISDNILLGEHDIIKNRDTLHTFGQSIIYLFAEGGMLFAAIIFLLIFIWRQKEREYLSFAFLCLSSMILATPFFTRLLPIDYPNNIPFLFFYKCTLPEGLFLIAFFASSLVIQFVKKKEIRAIRITRISILAISSILTFTAPSYEFLMMICPYMIALSILQLVLGFVVVFDKKLSEEEKHNFKILMIAFIPLIVSIVIDIFIREVIQKADTPYATLFGWLITICDFMVLLSLRYNKAVSQNEYMNVQLRREVLKQTKELSEKNITLEDQINRSEADLEMAAIVQKKFFPYPPKSLKGWDIAVSYSPLDKVSGDMYDFYVDSKGNILNGFSLFDVSGHGIAASLVTMLAKNIIFQAFTRNLRRHENVSRTLYEINNEIIEAKGEIENYLTGLMFRFGKFDKNDECEVSMANAGHPNPILYSAKSNICDEIETHEEHHGAIGLDFIEVSFPQVDFSMAEDDILVFYTDGLTESRRSDGQMFGKERVKRIIKENFAKDAQSIMEELIDSFQSFTEGVKRDDDITVVVMKRENSSNFIEELGEVDDFG